MPIAYSPDALVYDSGTNSWTLRPDYDPELHRVNISITDDDGFLDGDAGADEIGSDTSQSAIVTDMSGNPIASGQIYDEEFYAVWDGVNPHIYIERVEIAGVHVGYVVSAPLAPGTVYSQSTVGDVGADTAAAYSTFADVPPCYALGTRIDTAQGPRAVETLQPGDLVMTQDHGPQPIRWIHRGDHPLEDAEDDARPVQIKAGALGRNLPVRDMIVSPQHRILVGGGGQLDRVFASEAFAPAKSLTAVPGIRHMKGKTEVTWVHFACDRHEVVTANGCRSESLLLGPMVVTGLPATERRALCALFGSAPAPDAALNGLPARTCLTVGEARRRLARHREEKGQSVARDIREWDRDLAMERFEAERLRAVALGRSRDHERCVALAPSRRGSAV